MNLIIKRGLLAGVVNLIIGFGLNWLLGIIFPSMMLEYQNTAIFRPWSDPLMTVYFGYPFVLGLVLAYFWEMAGKELKGNTPVEKALGFATLYFIIATIPGMFISYTSFQVSLVMIAAWTVTGFIQAFVAGWGFAQ